MPRARFFPRAAKGRFSLSLSLSARQPKKTKRPVFRFVRSIVGRIWLIREESPGKGISPDGKRSIPKTFRGSAASKAALHIPLTTPVLHSRPLCPAVVPVQVRDVEVHRPRRRVEPREPDPLAAQVVAMLYLVRLPISREPLPCARVV